MFMNYPANTTVKCSNFQLANMQQSAETANICIWYSNYTHSEFNLDYERGVAYGNEIYVYVRFIMC